MRGIPQRRLQKADAARQGHPKKSDEAGGVILAAIDDRCFDSESVPAAFQGLLYGDLFECFPRIHPGGQSPGLQDRTLLIHATAESFPLIMINRRGSQPCGYAVGSPGQGGERWDSQAQERGVRADERRRRFCACRFQICRVADPSVPVNRVPRWSAGGFAAWRSLFRSGFGGMPTKALTMRLPADKLSDRNDSLAVVFLSLPPGHYETWG